ncbi:MAG: hypothetical protein ACT4QC_22005 [Planctomycetaceae bacterium]
MLMTLGGIAILTEAGCQETTTTGPATGSGRQTPGTPIDRDGRDVKRLMVMAAKDQTVERGETDKVLVTINRDNFNEAVQISLNDLPQGVEVVERNAVIAPNDNTVTLTLRAHQDAPLGEHLVTLIAEAPGIERNMQTFKLKIKDD